MYGQRRTPDECDIASERARQLAAGQMMTEVLLFCHFLADYPLQTEALVKAKSRLQGLCVHVAIHFLTMTVVTIGVLQLDPASVLPAILVLTVCHFLIDAWKAWLNRLRPRWVIFAYLQDQLLHLVSVILVGIWLVSASTVPLDDFWVRPALVLVLVTQTCSVTEYVLCYRSATLQEWLEVHATQRMIGRVLMTCAALVGWNPWGVATFFAGLFHHWLDLGGVYRTRALLTDLAVGAAGVVAIGCG